MCTTCIPDRKRLQSHGFGMWREGRSNAKLLADLMEAISETILLEEIVAINPNYSDERLELVVVFKSY
jgi:hypothetical protein